MMSGNFTICYTPHKVPGHLAMAAAVYSQARRIYFECTTPPDVEHIPRC